MSEFKIPTEMVELPSKGLLYPEGNPLREGKVEMKYMTAKEEDILTNQSYIKQGTVLDKLIQSLIVTKIDYNDLIIGDKNAIMIAARILGYGKDYSGTVICPECDTKNQVEIDLTKLPELPDLLRELYCNNNKLTELPDLSNLLIYLDYGNNNLTYLNMDNKTINETNLKNKIIKKMKLLNRTLLLEWSAKITMNPKRIERLLNTNEINFFDGSFDTLTS